MGALKVGPLADDFIYSDVRGDEIIALLEREPATLVLIAKDDFDWLQRGPNEPTPEKPLYLIGQGKSRWVLEHFTSVHVRGVPIEERQKQERWRRLVGNYLVGRYRVIYDDGSPYVLEDCRRNEGRAAVTELGALAAELGIGRIITWLQP